MSNYCANHFQNDDVKFSDYYEEETYTWCTNCGNYGIAAATKRALVSLNIKPQNTLMCFDIGCNGNGSDKIEGYRIHGLHGRVLPLASGAYLANKNITVIASGGDGATLSEGVNHLVHSIRNNYNFTFILHNNCNYGLTKGQASATTPEDVPMDSSPDGVDANPINVIHFVLSLGATFAARAFSGDVTQMTELIKAGIEHKGFSLIEVLQNCPTYNKTTPHEWYQDRVYDTLSLDGYDNHDLEKALSVSKDLEDKIATGILYQDHSSVPFEDRLENRQDLTTELIEEVVAKPEIVNELFEKFV